MTVESGKNDDDICPICFESLIGVCRRSAAPIPIDTEEPSSSISDTSTTSDTFTIGMNGPCGHCLHLSCYEQWDAMNISRKRDTKCPTCNTQTQFFLRLLSGTSDGSLQLPNAPMESASNHVPPRDPNVESQQQEAPCTVVCTPCGHVFNGQHQEWQQWMDNIIKRKEKEQKEFCHSNSNPQSRQRLGVCPLCNRSVACVMQLYSNLSTNYPISMLNDMDMTHNTDITGYIPNRVVVTGAGNSVVNGVYWWNSSKRYMRTGIWKNMLCNFRISVCTLRSGLKCWFISIVTDHDNEGTDKDIDFYRARILEACPAFPPRDGWIIYGTASHGYAPCPKLSHQYCDPVSGHIQEILNPLTTGGGCQKRGYEEIS